jgi:hypothetical protein
MVEWSANLPDLIEPYRNIGHIAGYPVLYTCGKAGLADKTPSLGLINLMVRKSFLYRYRS